MTSSTVQTGAREWATRVVQWNPARNAIKYAVHGYAGIRGRVNQRSGKVPTIANIYAASSPKAGSQWMKALLSHSVVRAHTGLFTLPQLDYQQDLQKVFPAGTFVPGIYCSYDEYLQMPKPLPHRTIYMLRDPRDLVVSGYYSAVKTHRKLNDRGLEEFRDTLRAMPFDEGLRTLITAAAPRLHEMATWVDIDDDRIETFRLEEVSADPHEQVDRILRHCGVQLSADELEAVLMDVSREALQAKDLAQRKDGSESHYRVDRKTFRDVFKPEHYAAMEAAAPGLATRLGYLD